MVKPPTVLGTKLTRIFYHELINQSRENDRKKRQIERNIEKKYRIYIYPSTYCYNDSWKNADKKEIMQ